MGRVFNNAEYIDTNDEDEIKTFSTIINNDDILQMYFKRNRKKENAE